METYEGKVTEIIYRNSDNGYTVGVLEYPDGVITFVGTFIALEEYDYIKISGYHKLHPNYGQQLDVREYQVPELTDTKSILSYLASGVIDEIGPKMALRIVEKFGDKTLEIFDYEPERLLEIEGIGKKKQQKIIESYNLKVRLRTIVMGLSEYDISPNLAMKIYKSFGDHALESLRENPYQICARVKGVGFIKADEIARKIGIARDSINRIMEGIKFVLDEFSYQGNTFLYFEDLQEKSCRMLSCSNELFAEALYELCIKGSVVLENKEGVKRVYLYSFYQCENEIAQRLSQLLESPVTTDLKGRSSSAMIKETEDRLGKTLADKQREAVSMALENNIMVLTGGPGTGKTTIVRFIIECFEQLGEKVTLCAPTGRAAKRLSESSGKKASTIHRLLEVGYTGEDEQLNFYNKDEENPLDTDVLIIDEMSMVDVFLMKALLTAIKKGTILIMVGDKDQLPSVGPGKVLWDLIDSHLITTVTLSEIFRQAKESNIILNAHRVNHGKEMVIQKGDTDFFFLGRNSAQEAKDLVIDLISHRLPNYYKVEPKDIQILTPIKKSGIGVLELNRGIQERINPSEDGKPEFKHGDRMFRKGDKVMQIKNNYDKEFTGYGGIDSGKGVFNGDIGYIDAIDTRAKQFYVSFEDGRRSKYEFAEGDNIEHAYAITVHKSQGSEFDIVIIPILALPPMMRSRNILYTALTRSKKVVVLVGSMYHINQMIKGNDQIQRNSSLGDRLNLYKNMMVKE